MSLKDYIIRDIQEKFKYLPSAVYLALICIAMYIFVCLLRYLFTMREVSQADERRKKEGQQKLLDEEKYELLGVRNEGGLLAFLAVWEFAEFVFIEHFADC